ncbi:hypothetical protein TNCV_986251 [Trichonephila clavipes]|uniref:Uncharacterized protein n=1 Tax=Trichonephila clavipes TaxID=2585209 RepID=A0A8X6VMN5_TRICX|nr:hypothetical protein TNCV_986251 [Trichonephila clavipes]
MLHSQREEEKREETEKEKKKSQEREEPTLDGEKGLVRDWSGKTMNAGGVENRIWTDCTGLAYGLNSIASVTNSLANKQCFYIILGYNLVALHFKYDFWLMTATAGSDVVQSGRLIFDDFFQHLWPYIGNNTANVVF